MEKINISKLLKDCPKGMELDCSMFDNLFFDYVDENDEMYPIKCYIQQNSSKMTVVFSQYGEYTHIENSKCVIFPKHKTTWDGFRTPFKDGDILITNLGTIFIFSYTELEKYSDRNICRAYVALDPVHGFKITSSFGPYESVCSYASEEEKNILFKAINDNCYKWDTETKTLKRSIKSKLKFKIGDKIRQKGSDRYYVITFIEHDRYVLHNNQFVKFADEKIYELVPDKFDINTLVAFDSLVLTRDDEKGKWLPAVWGFYNKDSVSIYPYEPYEVVGGHSFKYCIPYKGNEYLLGTTNDCDEFYKTWKTYRLNCI